jgi:superfamily II DNA or RNA helicase
MLEDPEPALVSMPTGSGKTAVGQALRYIGDARRTLVVVPSKDLRRQLASQFGSEHVLREIGALTGNSHPNVLEHAGREINWDSMRAYDVVVAIPSSISPAMLGDNLPPADMFDLVLIDEAHHTPAKTWKALLDHFESARSVLLTATPQRRDGQILPGRHVFHYPVRLALKHKVFKPIVPRILDLVPALGPATRDEAILTDVVALAEETAHRTSAILIRAASADRADELARAYSERGLDCLPLHWKLSGRQRTERVDGWRRGEPRALAVVDMLGEGIDVPNLRIVVYHDKHKSFNATIQLIGRLARVHSEYPQDSIIVTARDHDVFPALQGVVRELYKEDADWVKVLPEIVDEQIVEARRDREFSAGFNNASAAISLEAIKPMARVTFYETQLPDYQPLFAEGEIPDSLIVGRWLRGQEIIYSGVHSNTLLIILTASILSPRWYRGDSSLNSTSYDLHVVSWHPARDVGVPSLLMINTQDQNMCTALRRVVDPGRHCQAGRPESVQAVFEALDRTSVSSVGVRSTQIGAAGTATYAMFAGSGVDRGLREADTHSRALGHAMAQVAGDVATVTVGFSARKAKYWETQYLSLREYAELVDGLAGRYREPRLSDAGVLLPNVARGVRTESFKSRPLAAEMNPALRGRGWELDDGTALASIFRAAAG